MTMPLRYGFGRSDAPPCSGDASRNMILAALQPSVQALLKPHCSRVPLMPGRLLLTAGGDLQPIYFPESGAISLVSTLSTGHSVQIALIDRSGAAGLPYVDLSTRLPFDAVAQLAGTAVRIQPEGIAIAMKDASFVDAFYRYLHRATIDSAHLTACNAFHSVEQRTARWLLMLADIAGNDIPITHDALSTMLGVRRPSITLGAQALQQCGAIRCHHGRITITNRSALELRACACFRPVRHVYND